MDSNSDAGEDLASPPQVGDLSNSDVTVPMDLLPGCKVGDTYTVKSTDNGDVTLSLESSGDTDDWEGAATAAMKGAE